MIRVRELMATDAESVGRLESQLHPPELCDGAARHREHIEQACAEGVNLSFGLFDGDEMIGYLLCFGFERAAFPGATGEAIYIEDVAVLKPFRGKLFRLVEKFLEQVAGHFPAVPLEAHSLEHIVPIWRRHQRLFGRYGALNFRHADTGERIGGEARYALRWDMRRRETPSGERLDSELAVMLRRLESHDAGQGRTGLSFKILQSEADWALLAREWDRLLLATPEHTVFQSYGYQWLWWRHFGDDRQLHIVLILEQDEIVGIAPMQIQPVKLHGRYLRELSFIGSRWEVDRPTFLLGAQAAELLPALIGFLVRRRGAWDFASFYEQPRNPQFDMLEGEFARVGCLTARSRDSDCPYLDVQGGWDAFLAEKSQKFRKNLKAAAKKLRELGKLEYHVYTDAAEVARQLEAYRGIEQRSWKSAESVGVSRSDDYFAFYRELAGLFGRDNAFVIRMLTLDGRPVAGTFGLEHDRVYYSLQIAHDREFDRCSPGTYLEALEIEECFRGDFREYEFLGGFLNNKARWTSTFRRTDQLHVFRRTPFLVLVYLIFFRLKPWVKEIIRPYMKSWRQAE